MGSSSQDAGTAAIDFAQYLHDDTEQGVFSVRRDIFTDPEIYDREMEYIFESNWVFLCHESQLPNPNDFYTTHIGRQPVVVVRNQQGELNGFINACSHKGSKICLTRQGNTKFHTCSYHGWVFDNDGNNVAVKDNEDAAYSDAFKQLDFGLKKVPKVAEYRGWIFGSIEADVVSLEDHLGDMKLFIDLLVDQSVDGMELIPGMSSYTFNGNWKMQIENCLDGYHLNVAHKGFLEITNQRVKRLGDKYTGPDIEAMFNTDLQTGSFGWDQGHALFFTENPAPEFRPLWPERENLAKRIGEAKTDWMIRFGRNFTIFPNVQCTDNAVIGQFRVLRPLAHNKTEMQIYCWVPKGEAAAARQQRLRTYEDFFDIAGTGTPDDVAAYMNCQEGAEGRLAQWQLGYGRGQTALTNGANSLADELGLKPATSTAGPLTMSDETLFHASYRAWLKMMTDGQKRAQGKPTKSEPSQSTSKAGS
ncbi:MAG: Rieske 2Fe-2S domain-containing protein [Immundisolibacteraceae bacterium]|nr:Rieske 2Fe-2S domain-containing protein [Immundisolibacteraceae bacterium]